MLQLQLLALQHILKAYAMKKRLEREKSSFGYRFAMLHRMQGALCRPDIVKAGIQSSHLPFLLALVLEEAPVTQDHLSKRLAIDKGTTARAVSQLEKTGFVNRATNPENRRQNLVSATSKAQSAAEGLFQALDNAADIFLGGFSDEERAVILSLTDRMVSNGKKALYETPGKG